MSEYLKMRTKIQSVKTNPQNDHFTDDQLQQIDKADDLKISPFREDGVTYGTPTWVWAVVSDGALYVRAYNGKGSQWYQAAVRQKAGRIHAAGLTIDVTFEAVIDPKVNQNIDEEYKSKYSGSPYLPPMINNRTRESTIKISVLKTGM